MNYILTSLINFGKDWGNGLSEPAAYPQFLSRPWWKTFLFALLSCFLLGSLHWSLLVTRSLPVARTWVFDQLHSLGQRYPAELVISWDGQHLTHTWPELVKVPFPDQSNTDLGLPATLLAITPSSSSATLAITPEFIQDLATTSLIVLTSDKIFVQDQQHQVTEALLSEVLVDVPTGQISRNNWPEVSQKLVTIWNMLEPVLKVALAILMPLVILVSVLWSSLLDGLLSWFVLRLSGLPLSFGKTWQLSLHITLVAELANFLVQLMLPDNTWPVAMTTYWVFFFIIVWSQRLALLSLATGHKYVEKI